MKKLLSFVTLALAATFAASATDTVHIVKNGVTSTVGTGYSIIAGQRTETSVNRTGGCTHGVCGYSYDRTNVRDNYNSIGTSFELSAGTYSLHSISVNGLRLTSTAENIGTVAVTNLASSGTRITTSRGYDVAYTSGGVERTRYHDRSREQYGANTTTVDLSTTSITTYTVD